MRIQVLKQASGTILYSKVLTGAKSDIATQYARATANTDRDLQAIEAALRELDSDKEFKSALTAPASSAAHTQ